MADVDTVHKCIYYYKELLYRYQAQITAKRSVKQS